MRVLIATLVAGALVISGAFAAAEPVPPKPDLRTSDVVPILSGDTLAVYATIKNKGSEKAKASSAAFFLSADAIPGNGDMLLGTAPVKRLRPKKKVTIYPYLTVPSSTPPGAYYVVVCADSRGKVKEKKEGNNCASSPGTITIADPDPPLPSGYYSVRVAPYLGWVSISVNGDAPSPGLRTLVFPAGTSVVLTVTANNRYSWTGDWRSPDPSKPCDGTESDAAGGYSMTFSSLSHSVNCAAYGVYTG
jgi:hypothetical protein